MQDITVVQLFAVVVAVAGLMLTVLRISDMTSKRNEQKKAQDNKAIMDKLDAIQQEQKEIKTQLVSVMSLTVTMAEELQQKGHVNGGTDAELSKLKQQLYNK